MSKIVIINEAKYRHLFEAMDSTFSFSELKNLTSFAARLDYCKKHFGYAIGNGSSRVVFQIDDETVLKLAKNRKGVAQNMSEYEKGNDYYINSVFPRVYDVSDGENYLWIVSEYVLPAKKEDFEKILGIPFSEIITYCNLIYHEKMRRSNGGMLSYKMCEKYEDNEAVTDIFNTLNELCYGYEMLIPDFACIENWGMVMRDGEPVLLPIDAGCTTEIFNKHYLR